MDDVGERCDVNLTPRDRVLAVPALFPQSVPTQTRPLPDGRVRLQPQAIIITRESIRLANYDTVRNLTVIPSPPRGLNEPPFLRVVQGVHIHRENTKTVISKDEVIPANVSL